MVAPVLTELCITLHSINVMYKWTMHNASYRSNNVHKYKMSLFTQINKGCNLTCKIKLKKSKSINRRYSIGSKMNGCLFFFFFICSIEQTTEKLILKSTSLSWPDWKWSTRGRGKTSLQRAWFSSILAVMNSPLLNKWRWYGCVLLTMKKAIQEN